MLSYNEYKDLIQKQSDELIESTKQSVSNIKRIAIGEAWKLLQIAIAAVVQIIENIATDLSGKDKKQIAMECLNKFYDSVFIVIDIPMLPPFLEPIIHRYIKMILMVLVSSSIDATVTIFRNTGIFIKKGMST